MSKTSTLEFGLTLERYRPFLFPIIFLLFFVVSLGRVVAPRIGAITEEIAQMKEAKAELERLNEKLSFLKGVDEEKARKDNQLLLQVLPTEKDPFYGMSVIEWLGGKTGVKIKGISFTPGLVSTDSAKLAKKTKVEEEAMEYEVGLIGTLAQLEDFLMKLENLTPLVTVDEVDLSFKIGANEVETGLNLQMFSARYPETIGKPSDPLAAFSDEELKYLTQLGEEALVPESNPELLIGDPLGKDNLFD